MKILENKSNYVVIKGNGKIMLFSYVSYVAYIENNELHIIDGFEHYSRTTSKHITQFKNKYIY